MPNNAAVSPAPFDESQKSSCNVEGPLWSHVIPRIEPDVQGTTLDGETIVLHLTSGRYYTLNRVGSTIWELCNGSNTLHTIHAALCARFEVSPERAHQDLMSLVTLLEEKKLVRLNKP